MGSLTPDRVTAVVVTRGDLDLNEVYRSLWPVGFHEILVWNNSTGLLQHLSCPDTSTPGQWVSWTLKDAEAVGDLAVYGRYAALAESQTEIVFVQDDDCRVDAGAIVRLAGRYNLEREVVCNMPESRWDDYPDSALVGWGAVFHRSLPQTAFDRFSRTAPGFNHGAFNRECDVIFTVLTDCVKIDLGFEHLPGAEDPDRAMFKRPWRAAERNAMYELARKVRDETKEG